MCVREGRPAMKDESASAAATAGADAARDFYRLGETPPRIRERYSRLVLVSHPRHFAGIPADDDETLIITHSWLLWHQALAEGRHCVHYEAATNDLPPADQASDIHVRCNDWLFADGADPTLFHGVSLGSRFSREMGLLITERERLARALEILIGRYRPAEVIYVDFRAEHSVMDAAERFAVVAEITAARGVVVVDRRDPPAGDDPWLPFAEFYGRRAQEETAHESRLRKYVRGLLVAAFDAFGSLRRRLAPRRHAILMANTHLTALPLIEGFAADDAYALVLADWYPNKRDLGFVLRNLVRGVLPAGLRRLPLDEEDHHRLDVIERALIEGWRAAPRGHEDAIRRYVGARIIAPGRLRAVAADVKWAERLLAKHRPDVVYSDGLDYYLCHILFIVAKALGIATVGSWHAHYLQDTPMAVLGCDPRIPPAIDHFLTWGRVNEAWLAAIGAKTRPVRTGCPVTFRSGLRGGVVGRGKRVLLLQYVATGEDHVYPQGAQYAFFVEVVRMLGELGFNEIRLKVHPGPYSREHYQRVANAFGLRCAIYKDEPFRDQLAWANIVIGPVVSGAMTETLGAGKPYYPVLLPPHAVNERYLEGLPVFRSAAALGEALGAGKLPDFARLLADFAALDEFADPARRTWQVLRDIAAANEKNAA